MLCIIGLIAASSDRIMIKGAVQIEQWQEVFKSQIPKDQYAVILQHSESQGLILNLQSQKYQVVIDFGVVSAFRVVDEGMILNDAAQDKTMLNFRETKFKNVIYRITGGDFSEYIRRIGGNLYNLLELKHYLVVSENYVFDVITAWEPELEVTEKEIEQ